MTVLFTLHLAYSIKTNGFKSKTKERRVFSTYFTPKEREGHLPCKYIFKGALYFLTLTLVVTLKRCQGHLAGR
jgi:hypothetical protein